MSTQLSNVEIIEVNGNTLIGTIESVYDDEYREGVGHGHRSTGASVLVDVWDHMDEPNAKWDEIVNEAYDGPRRELLESYIISFLYETPNRPKSKFTMIVSDPDLIAQIPLVAWESYYV